MVVVLLFGCLLGWLLGWSCVYLCAACVCVCLFFDFRLIEEVLRVGCREGPVGNLCFVSLVCLRYLFLCVCVFICFVCLCVYVFACLLACSLQGWFAVLLYVSSA